MIGDIMRILLARHGETPWNAEGRYQGQIDIPLSPVGEAQARALGERYVRNPQVTVTVVEAAGQKVTVDGAVTKPGVYEMQGRTSLMQAVAMAEGPSRVADLSKVAIFRTVDNQRAVAVFDLAAIRRGQAADPVVYGDDVIVVDTSRLSSVMRTAVEALPALAIFRNY